MHNGFVRVDNEKMSKSLGNFFTIRDVLKEYDAETLRFFMVRTLPQRLELQRRPPDDARQALKRLYTALSLVKPADVTVIDWADPGRTFRAAMDEDFGTPEAVAVLFDLAGEVNRSQSAAAAPACSRPWGPAWDCCRAIRKHFAGRCRQHADEAAIAARIAERAAAKAAKEFCRSRPHPQ